MKIKPLCKSYSRVLSGLLVFLFTVFTVFGTTPQVQAADFSGGSGTKASPYIINTAEQLDKVRNNMSAFYKLGSDIDLSYYDNWLPIGDENNKFKGGLDGAGYKISSLIIDRPSTDYIGLFGYVETNRSFNSLMRSINLSKDKD